MENQTDLSTLQRLISLIESGKITEVEAERLLNSYTRALTKTPTNQRLV